MAQSRCITAKLNPASRMGTVTEAFTFMLLHRRASLLKKEGVYALNKE